ncbi:MAG: long-chain-fatty-acid CoA ligase [Leptospirillum sp. Group II 'C75']|uniref:AMP-binding protein n=1 Tax=Leptospirillum ferriphilum TaxID=178606 RepID=UPI00029CBED3|nr:AMP-binding protein [Leptospirillum ferriphilum]EIJ75563.1 MAG: long-chain-fatty-acid CoA ligase [Leptospirillum sp. Group II 'C75']
MKYLSLDGTPNTLFHFVLAWSRIRPDSPFVGEWLQEGEGLRYRAWSYREMLLLALEFGRTIRSLGLPPRTPVGLSASPGPAFIGMLLSLESEDLLPVLLDHAMPSAEMCSTLKNFGGRTLFLEKGLWEPETGERSEVSVHLFARSPKKPSLPEGEEWSRLLEESFERVSKDENREACLLLTSGTTGFPRGVSLTHGNLFSNVRSIENLDIYHSDSRVFGVLPLHHAYPLMSLLYLPVGHGATVAFPPDLQPSTLAACLSEFSPTLFPGVPSLWENFHRRIWEGIDRQGKKKRWLVQKILMPLVLGLRRKAGINPGRLLFASLHARFGPSMKILASGGAALPRQVAEDFWSWGLTMLEGYGLTETSPVLTFNTPRHVRLGSVGKAIPGVDLRIRPLDGQMPGEGEVQARGSNVALEYRLDAENRKPVREEDGWFSTGDIGRLEDGFLFLKGREKELLVLPNGKKLQPDAVEGLLEKDDLVLELALTLYHGVPWLLIRPDEDAFARRHIVQMKPVMESKVAALNARLPGHSRIGGFSITLDPMPRTRLGKLKRFVLPEIVTSLEKRHSTSPVPEGVLEDPAKKEVLRVLKEVTGLDRPVSLSDHLEVDLGLDSLGRIELAGRLEDLTGGPLEEEVFDSVRTVQDLLDIMSGRLVRISGEKADVRILEPDLTEVEKAFIPSRPSTRDGALPLWFQLLHKILRAVFSVVFGIRWPRFSDNGGQWQVTGPGGGRIDWPSSPFVLVANHESYLDGILLSLMLPPAILREVMFWGYSPLFEQGILKKWKNILGVVSIDPEEAVTGLRIGYHLLREGRSLAIFPEGERSLSGSLQTFRPGTGYILSACPVPVIPCAIFGAFKAWPRHRKFPRPATIRLRIGPVIPADRIEGQSGNRITALLEESVRALLILG